MKYVILIHSNPQPWGHPTSDFLAEHQALSAGAARRRERRLRGAAHRALAERRAGRRRAAGRAEHRQALPLGRRTAGRHRRPVLGGQGALRRLLPRRRRDPGARRGHRRAAVRTRGDRRAADVDVRRRRRPVTTGGDGDRARGRVAARVAARPRGAAAPARRLRRLRGRRPGGTGRRGRTVADGGDAGQPSGVAGPRRVPPPRRPGPLGPCARGPGGDRRHRPGRRRLRRAAGRRGHRTRRRRPPAPAALLPPHPQPAVAGGADPAGRLGSAPPPPSPRRSWSPRRRWPSGSAAPGPRCATNGARFEAPTVEELPTRVAAVLDVLYLVFNEGYARSSGDTLVETSLAEEAIHLTRQLHAYLPGHDEVAGALALMLLTDARRAARVDRSRGPRAAGRAGPQPVGPPTSSTRAWRSSRRCSREGPSAHTSCRRRSPPSMPRPPAPRTPTGRRSSCSTRCSTMSHRVRRSRSTGRWPSGCRPVRSAGLEALQPLLDDPAMDRYHRLHAVRAHLLELSGDVAAAEVAYARAAELTGASPSSGTSPGGWRGCGRGGDEGVAPRYPRETRRRWPSGECSGDRSAVVRKGSAKVTLSDVASRAGVSVTTASFVLSGRRDMRISEATQERVHQSARGAQLRAAQPGRVVAAGASPVDRADLRHRRHGTVRRRADPRLRDRGDRTRPRPADDRDRGSARARDVGEPRARRPGRDRLPLRVDGHAADHPAPEPAQQAHGHAQLHRPAPHGPLGRSGRPDRRQPWRSPSCSTAGHGDRILLVGEVPTTTYTRAGNGSRASS